MQGSHGHGKSWKKSDHGKSWKMIIFQKVMDNFQNEVKSREM